MNSAAQLYWLDIFVPTFKLWQGLVLGYLGPDGDTQCQGRSRPVEGLQPLRWQIGLFSPLSGPQVYIGLKKACRDADSGHCRGYTWLVTDAKLADWVPP